MLAGNAVLDWNDYSVLTKMDAFPFKLVFLWDISELYMVKTATFHPHITILCIHDAMIGFCGFNSITFSKHYKDNIEVLNRQRFTENPGPSCSKTG